MEDPLKQNISFRIKIRLDSIFIGQIVFYQEDITDPEHFQIEIAKSIPFRTNGLIMDDVDQEVELYIFEKDNEILGINLIDMAFEVTIIF